MNIRARYDPREDRMRLELQPEIEESKAFSLNRRQWLNLIRAVGVTDFPQHKMPPQPPAAQGGQQGSPLPDLRVNALKFRQEKHGLRVVFLLEGSPVGVLLPNDGLPEIGEMLFRQAERAGWDPAAALDRLKAEEMARETLLRAKASN
jgi:hypothetical protein